jgi:PKHD-type hydroxylase
MVSYYYFWDKKLSHEVCQKIIKLGKGKWNQAETLGSANKGKKLAAIRKSDIVWVRDKWVYDLITPYMITANRRAEWKYNIVAAQDCQVTRYTKDGFYDWHKDGIGSHGDFNFSKMRLLHNEYSVRKLSMTIVLNSDYEGGDFEILGDMEKVPRFEEGSIIVFPSFLDHRVTPVTKGIRYSLVAWFVGPPFV